MAEANYSQVERELLLTETAASRSSESEAGAGVVLTKSGRTFCTCEDEADAKLIVKLFNCSPVPRPHL